MRRKECFASLFRVHKWLDPFDDRDYLLIPPDILDELWLACLLLGVSEANIRWPVAATVSATDATPDSGGTVRTMVD
eukprot:11755175-Karenia_brevis.AAC.1